MAKYKSYKKEVYFTIEIDNIEASLIHSLLLHTEDSFKSDDQLNKAHASLLNEFKLMDEEIIK